MNVGIAESAGVLPFYVNHDLSEWSSFDFQIGSTRGPYSTLEIPTPPLAELVDEFGMPYT